MRNFILATALLLTAGIAYAQTEATETETDAVAYPSTRPTRTPTTVIGEKTGKKFFELKDAVVTNADDVETQRYTWTVSQYSGWNANDPKFPQMADAKQNGGRYNLSSTLVRYDKEAFSYKAFDANDTSKEWELSVVLDKDGNVDLENSKNLISYRDVYNYKTVQKEGDDGKLYTTTEKGEFLRRVYYFSVPVGEVEYWTKDENGNYVLDENGKRVPLTELKYPVAELGVKVGDAVSTMNPTDPSLFYIIDSKQNGSANYYLAFGKSANADNRTDPEIAFGQPLPAPLATLLIALGFGAAFVMYRNRKQAKA